MDPIEAAARRAASGSVCAYCGLDRLDGSQKPEHPIPAVLDSEIVVFTVCNDCNTRAGREVDQPFLGDTLILLERHRWPSSHPRARGRRVGHPFLNGGAVDADGTHLVLKDGEARYGGSIVPDGDDRITIKSDSPEDTERALARVRKRLARDGYAIGSVTNLDVAGRPLKATVSRPFSLEIGVRMGAKMALALASETFDEAWRLSDEAEQLRTWLWDPTPKDPETGTPIHYNPIATDAYPYGDPPNHVAHFNRLDGALCLTVALYGRLPFPVPVAPLDTPPPARAWRAGPAHGTAVNTTLDQIERDAVVRFLERTPANPTPEENR